MRLHVLQHVPFEDAAYIADWAATRGHALVVTHLYRGDALPDAAANTEPKPPFFEKFVTTPHSVVTVHLIDEAGQPTLGARDEILGFFARRLGG